MQQDVELSTPRVTTRLLDDGEFPPLTVTENKTRQSTEKAYGKKGARELHRSGIQHIVDFTGPASCSLPTYFSSCSQHQAHVPAMEDYITKDMLYAATTKIQDISEAAIAKSLEAMAKMLPTIVAQAMQQDIPKAVTTQLAMMETKMAEEFAASLSNEMAKLEDLDAEFRLTFLETMVPAELEKITNFIQNINTGVGLKDQGPNPLEVGSPRNVNASSRLCVSPAGTGSAGCRAQHPQGDDSSGAAYFNSLSLYISSPACIQKFGALLNDIELGPEFTSQSTATSCSAPSSTASSLSTPSYPESPAPPAARSAAP